MFKKDETSFPAFLTGIINEQSLLLQARIGAANYAVSASPMKDYAKLAEKCLVAAELCQRRINILLANVTGAGQELDTSTERSQMKIYRQQGDELIQKILAGGSMDSGSDMAFSTLVSDHFRDGHV
jgi:hypothetical protein